MSMPALQFDDDHPILDPDSLKMPESAAHRGAIDLVGLAVTHLLGSQVQVFRDMNWYPTDGGGPLAPDLMVLPAGTTEPSPTSYRQDQDGGPHPLAVVEVPSASDSYVSFRAKASRLHQLGAVVYLVIVQSPGQAVLRLGPGDREPQPWSGRPMEELGGIRLAFEAGDLVLTTPTGLRGRSDADLLASIERRAEAAESLVVEVQGRAEAAEEQLAALLRQMEAHGITPEIDPPAST